MSCTGDISNLCADPIFATCVDYQGTLGVNTKITSDCVTQNDVNEDLYAIVDELISNSDTSLLGSRCITYTLVDGEVTLSNALDAIEAKVCELDTTLSGLNNLENIDVSGWTVDFGCLENECFAPITTLGGFAQAVATAICDGIVPPAFATQPRITTGAVVGTNIVLTRDDATDIVIDGSTLFDDTNLARITSGTLAAGILTLTRDDLSTIGIDMTSLLDDTNLPRITSGTITGGNLVLVRDDASSVVVDVSTLIDDTNLARIVSGTVVGNTMTLTRDDASTIPIDVTTLVDNTNLSRIISGTVGGGTLTLTRDDASVVNIDVSSLGGGGGGTVTSIDVAGGVGLTSSGGPISGFGVITVDLDNTAVTPGSYTNANITVDAQGRITAASNGAGGGGGGQVDTIVAGDNITVDATDPVNPIVNAVVPVSLGVSSITNASNALNTIDDFLTLTVPADAMADGDMFVFDANFTFAAVANDQIGLTIDGTFQGITNAGGSGATSIWMRGWGQRVGSNIQWAATVVYNGTTSPVDLKYTASGITFTAPFDIAISGGGVAAAAADVTFNSGMIKLN